MPAIVFHSQKGGTGKTTGSLSTAAALAHKGHKTLLIDLDSQGDSGRGLGIEPSNDSSIAAMFFDQKSAKDIILKDVRPGLDLLPGSIQLENLEREISTMGEGLGLALFSTALTPVFEEYEYVIIDTRSEPSPLTSAAIMSCNHLVIPTELGLYQVQAMVNTLGYVGSISIALGKLKSVGVLISQYDKTAALHSTFLDIVDSIIRKEGDTKEVVEKVRVPVHRFEQVIRQTKSLDNAAASREDVISHRKNSHGAVDYLGFAEEMKTRFSNG